MWQKPQYSIGYILTILRSIRSIRNFVPVIVNSVGIEGEKILKILFDWHLLQSHVIFFTFLKLIAILRKKERGLIIFIVSNLNTNTNNIVLVKLLIISSLKAMKINFLVWILLAEHSKDETEKELISDSCQELWSYICYSRAIQ